MNTMNIVEADGKTSYVYNDTFETRALGNAVVPQIPEIIGRAIMTRVHEDG